MASLSFAKPVNRWCQLAQEKPCRASEISTIVKIRFMGRVIMPWENSTINITAVNKKHSSRKNTYWCCTKGLLQKSQQPVAIALTAKNLFADSRGNIPCYFWVKVQKGYFKPHATSYEVYPLQFIFKKLWLIATLSEVHSKNIFGRKCFSSKCNYNFMMQSET